jgi:hypothetical protein
MGPIGRPETSVQNCHSTLLNVSKETRSDVHRARKPEIMHICGLFNDAISNLFH